MLNGRFLCSIRIFTVQVTTILIQTGMVLRTQLTSIIDEAGFGAVLQGHDHTYSVIDFDEVSLTVRTFDAATNEELVS